MYCEYFGIFAQYTANIMEKLLIRQKNERDFLLSRNYVPRLFEDEMGKYLDASPVKLITGPRRAGKSVFALRMLREKNFAYLNFDDAALVESFDEDRILDALSSVYPGFRYIVLDEVQNLPQWNDWVAKLYRLGFNMIITGSNSNLLSKEMESKLTGRYVSKEIFPFSFREFCESRGIGNGVSALAGDYLHYGGYPEVINNRDIAVNYLSSLFDSIISKDIVRRFKVRKSEELYSLADLLVANYSSEISFKGIAEELGIGSENTIAKFISHLQMAYLFYLLPRFDFKFRTMNKAPRKVYVIDNGLITAKGYEISPNLGRRLENLVFIELLRRGYVPGRSLFYYHTRHDDKEIDFVCRTGTKVTEIIQVCYEMSTIGTLTRETAALDKASRELDCDRLKIIVWNEPSVTVDSRYNVARFSDWALHSESPESEGGAVIPEIAVPGL